MFASPTVLSPDVNQPSMYPFTYTLSCPAIAEEAYITVAKPVAAMIFDLFIRFFLF